MLLVGDGAARHPVLFLGGENRTIRTTVAAQSTGETRARGANLDRATSNLRFSHLVICDVAEHSRDGGHWTIRSRAKVARAAHELAAGISSIAANRLEQGGRYRVAAHISGRLAESTVTAATSRPLRRRPQMQWTRRGAHVRLRPRTLAGDHAAADIQAAAA